MKRKPVAIIAAKFPQAMDYAFRNLEVLRYSNSDGRIVDKSGQVYIVVTSVRHMEGYEFSDFKVAPGAGDNPDFLKIYDYIGTRIR